MIIYGREYSREELLRHCNTEMLYGARRVLLSDGRGRGHRLVLGIEPGTSFVRGRKEELENGYDLKIPAFGKLEFGFEVALE